VNTLAFSLVEKIGVEIGIGIQVPAPAVEIVSVYPERQVGSVGGVVPTGRVIVMVGGGVLVWFSPTTAPPVLALIAIFPVILLAAAKVNVPPVTATPPVSKRTVEGIVKLALEVKRPLIPMSLGESVNPGPFTVTELVVAVVTPVKFVVPDL